MHDLIAGQYRLPYEGAGKVTDGTSGGFDKPVRRFGETSKPAGK
jgi:formamidase